MSEKTIEQELAELREFKRKFGPKQDVAPLPLAKIARMVQAEDKVGRVLDVPPGDIADATNLSEDISPSNGDADTAQESKPNQYVQYRECVAAALDHLKAAYLRGRFMVAIFSVENDRLLRETVSHDFPTGDLEPAVRMLKQWCQAEIERLSGQQPAAHLPRAAVNRQKPLDVMFGKKAEE
jgi:hypothetical protein